LELSGIELENLPQTYEKFFMREFKYFSDSRGIWSHGNPLESEAYSRKENLHILTHPIWWTPSPMSPFEKLLKIAENLDYSTRKYIFDNCDIWDKTKRAKD
jgi:hypothetical protein